MVTIKDVAKAAGVSATTVSLIINGQAKKRRISQQTADKVYTIMQELNYHPNSSARRLRSNENARPMIAFYWPSDYRSNILGSFMLHFSEAAQKLDFDCEVVVRTFTNNHFTLSAAEISKSSYNGIIIGGLSQMDLEELEQLKTRTPIVLLNRTSDCFSTVNSDNQEIGFLAARLMKQKGYKEAAVFTSLRPYTATGLRVQSFLYACAELNINIDASWIFRHDNTIEGGVHAAENFCRLKGAPKVIFCDSDFIALGALYTFHKRGIRLPDDVELISVQLLEDDYTKYATPPITTIPMQNAVIAENALSVMRKLINNPLQAPVHTLLKPEIVVRETFC